MMDFPFGADVIRDRRKRIPNSYNPQRDVESGWDDPDSITLEGAFVASSSSTAVTDATRSEVLSAKSLYCDPDADVRIGDRIRTGDGTWYVNELPEADTNPFTGWRPVREVPLDNTLG